MRTLRWATVPGADDEGGPVVADEVGREVVDAVALDHVEPDELEVEVVVGERVAGALLDVEGAVVGGSLSLEGGSEGAADVLSKPAAVDLVTVFSQIQGGHGGVFLCLGVVCLG